MSVAATIWMLYAAKDYFSFRFGSANFQKHQEKILKNIIRRNRNTSFGKEHGFRSIRDYRGFINQIPVSDHEDLEPYIQKQIEGEKALFREAISFVETTSGSVSAAKKILYNRSLRKVFSRMANAWMFSLTRNYRSLWSGKSYWSLSPALKNHPVKIEDNDYLSGFTGKILRKLLAVPASLNHERDATAFYDQTWLHLLSQKKVVFFSVWSPVFLIRLLQHLIDRNVLILEQMESLPIRKSGIAKKRLAAAGGRLTLSSLFPECKVISCWKDAQAGIHLDELRKLLGEGIAIQGKGLLLTEGVISFPIDDEDPVLAYNAHFYEFKSTGSGSIKRAHELQEGFHYEVIITTQAGLYRYNTCDVVKVTGFRSGLPRLRFMGRSNLLGDFVGEKLSYLQALNVISHLRNEGITAYAFSWKKDEAGAGYILLADKDVPSETEKEINQMLCANPYFAQAQKLKQLEPLKIEKADKGKIMKAAERLRQERNIAEGDFKEPLFVPLQFLRDE